MKNKISVKSVYSITKDLTSVLINYNGSGNKIYLIGAFPNNLRKIKLNDLTKSVTLNLPEGTFYYNYEVDGIITVDSTKPKEVINNVIYNVIFVKSQNSDHNDKAKLLNNKPEKFPISISNNTSNKSLSRSIHKNLTNKGQKVEKIVFEKSPGNILQSSIASKSFLDYSSTFSIKNENIVQEIEVNNPNESDKTEDSITVEGTKVIVYNINDEFLIPMVIVNTKMEGVDDNLIQLKYAGVENKDQEGQKEMIMLRKNEIFYQNIQSFDQVGNLAKVSTINELTFLKHTEHRLSCQKSYIYLDDILIITDKINSNGGLDFIIDEFFSEENSLIICKKLFFCQEKIFYSYIFKKAAYTLNSNLILKCSVIFDSIFSMINLDMKYLVHFYNNEQGITNINVIPLIETNLNKNELYMTSVFFKNKKKNKHKLNFPFNLENHTSEFRFVYNKLITNENAISYLNKIYSVFSLIGCVSKINEVIKLLSSAYFILNYNEITKEIKENIGKDHIFGRLSKLVKNYSNFSQNKLNFFSNALVMLTIQYVLSIINAIIVGCENIKKKKNVNFFIFVNDFSTEDEILLNEVVKKRTELYVKKSPGYSNNMISNFIFLNLEQIVNGFESNLSQKEKNFVSEMKDIFFTKETNDNPLATLKSLITKSLTQFEKVESNIKNKVRQIWYMNYPNNTFTNFIKDQDDIVYLFQTNLVLEYMQLYHSSHQNNKKFFREFSYKKFFTIFLPILTDVDTQFSKDKINIYEKKITDFIVDLQTYQKINENYLVTKDSIYLEETTFEILYLLLKNVYDERVSRIQKHFLRKVNKNSLINILKKKAIIIQNNYRSHLYSYYQKKNNMELASMILNRYKGNDPLLIMLLINSKNMIENLKKENNELKSKISLRGSNNYTANSNLRKMKVTSFLNSSSSNKSNRPYCDSISSISNQNCNTTRSNVEDVKTLKEKLTEARSKYKELLQVIIEYEKKMKNFISMINNNQEVKSVLIKNGIQIN